MFFSRVVSSSQPLSLSSLDLADGEILTLSDVGLADIASFNQNKQTSLQQPKHKDAKKAFKDVLASLHFSRPSLPDITLSVLNASEPFAPLKLMFHKGDAAGKLIVKGESVSLFGFLERFQGSDAGSFNTEEEDEDYEDQEESENQEELQDEIADDSDHQSQDQQVIQKSQPSKKVKQAPLEKILSQNQQSEPQSKVQLLPSKSVNSTLPKGEIKQKKGALTQASVLKSVFDQPQQVQNEKKQQKQARNPEKIKQTKKPQQLKEQKIVKQNKSQPQQTAKPSAVMMANSDSESENSEPMESESSFGQFNDEEGIDDSLEVQTNNKSKKLASSALKPKAGIKVDTISTSAKVSEGKRKATTTM